MNPFRNIGKRIAELRTREGWTQQELANRVNRTRFHPDVKQPHIAGIEKGEGNKLPSLSLMAALMEVFALPMEEIAGINSISRTTPNLLEGLNAEDRALVVAFVSRLQADSLDQSWELLNAARQNLGDREQLEMAERAHLLNF